nr:molybdopterin oxidoreductase family protein [Pseudenhygromyxa sp. WMMC2535]
MAGLCDKFAGISHGRIDAEGGIQWPCPDPSHPGTEFLHGDGPLKGKAEFQAAYYRPSEELPDDEYPLLLSTGRTLYHYNAATQTRRSSGAVARQPENFIEMHRKDARRRGLADGQLVRVSSRRGTVLARVNVSPRMRRGCVWMPLHFGDANTNYLTNDAGDPTTGTAEYKVCAVRVEAAEADGSEAAQ